MPRGPCLCREVLDERLVDHSGNPITVSPVCTRSFQFSHEDHCRWRQNSRIRQYHSKAGDPASTPRPECVVLRSTCAGCRPGRIVFRPDPARQNVVDKLRRLPLRKIGNAGVAATRHDSNLSFQYSITHPYFKPKRRRSQPDEVTQPPSEPVGSFEKMSPMFVSAPD